MITPVPILLYHRIDHSGERFSTTPEGFIAHLDWLADRGYRSLTAAELTETVTSGSPLKRTGRPFLLTFDDGFADLDTTVAPLLRERDFTAVAFLITGRCPAEPTPDSDRLAWSSARQLATEGLFAFHSHSHTHGPWPVDADQTDTVLDDLGTSLEVLGHELGQPRDSFSHLAWPFGDTCPEWESGARRLGLTTQYVVQRGAVTKAARSERLPRLLADGLSVTAVSAWMRVLSTSVGAVVGNQLFGTIRQLRRGSGYR